MARPNILHVPIDQWPDLDTSVLPDKERSRAERYIIALRMYATGEPMDKIFAATRVFRQEVLRQAKRCLRLAADGRVQGFRALTKGLRVASYKRTAKLTGILGDGGKGNAGALQQLFDRFPGAEQFLRDRYLRTHATDKNQDVRIRICKLHGDWINWLDEQGLKPNEWPHTTIDEARETVRRYCKGLLVSAPDRWIAARAGKNAGRRSHIGLGLHSIFPRLRPFGAVQLDFHKIDQASIVTITNPMGVDVDVPLARWHIGTMLEETLELVIGAVVVLEITPSAEATLETIESAILPIDPDAAATGLGFAVSRPVLPNQKIAELVGQAFSVLKMDNAWSNIAYSVIEYLITVVGCAVDFGPVRAWWTRSRIEAYFGRLTRNTAQCSPATYGANVADSRRDDPEGKAIHLQIRLSDILSNLEDEVDNHNETRCATNFMGSPLDSLRAAIRNPTSTFLPTRLPRIDAAAPTLMRMCSTKVIRGNATKGERPYLNINGAKYTNERIARDFGLIGKAVKVYQSLRFAHDVVATLVETGEQLGALCAPNRLVHHPVSYRMLRTLRAAGNGLRTREQRARKLLKQSLPTPRGATKTTASHRAPSQPKIGAKDALRMARETLRLSRHAQEDSVSVTTTQKPQKHEATSRGIFNVNVALRLKSQLKRGRS